VQVSILPLAREHYEALYELVKIAEPLKGFQHRDQFYLNLDSREGFTFWKGEQLVGLISFSDYFPGVSVVIHAMFHPDHRDAMNRKALKQVFGYAFKELLVSRVTTYSIKGVTDSIVKFIKGIGFKKEGRLRKAVELSGEFFDLDLYGMLLEDCKWV